MGIISGKQFLDRIDALDTEIWLDGRQILGPLSKHPAFTGVLQTKASLYDLQKQPELLDLMTFASSSDERAGMSFLQPRTKEDLLKRRNAMACWARETGGLLGRSPDYLNTVITSFACSQDFLKGKENCFPENIQALYDRARKDDLSFTHTFITPQVNRSQHYFESADEPISAKITGETADGLIINGARLLATQGGLTDEVLVFSAPSFLGDADEAFAFCIPSDNPGLRFLCRESFVGGESSFNYPLSSRFEEMDSVVVFENVLVPWDRIFFYRNPEVAAAFFSVSSFHPFAIHQVLTRQVVKTEFLLSLAEELVQTINVSEYLHIQGKIAEIIVGLETMKALRNQAEQEAELDQWGFMRPSKAPLQAASNLFPSVYPRFSEIIQLIGASGLVALPTENDFHSPIRPDLDRFLQGASRTAEDRVKVFRIAWDLTMSPFGSRQTQYERFFFGDPVRLAAQMYRGYPKGSGVDILKRLIGDK